MLDLIDTHCHLDYPPLDEQVDAVLTRAQQAGVRCCVSVGTSLASSQANVQLAQRYPIVRAAVGIHPHEAETVTDAMLAEIEHLAIEPLVVAIGEVGLDFHRNHASVEAQQRAFSASIGIAQRRHLPLITHCRDAYDTLLELLRHAADGDSLRGVMHCASGPATFIQEALELGFYVSFAGNVTFSNAKALRELVPLVPDNRLLIETDAPFLAPQPMRGKPNEPACVVHTAECLAQLRGMTVEAFSDMTSRNARRLFGLPELVHSR